MFAVIVSVLYREPKLLKAQRSEMLRNALEVSVLYREPKLLKALTQLFRARRASVSVLYREPKLLKADTSQGAEGKMKEFQCSTVSRNC